MGGLQRRIYRMRDDKAVRLSFGIAAVARPWIVARMGRQSGSHRVELDIAIAGEDIVRARRHGRPEASLPKCPGAPVNAVDALDILLAEALHQQPARVSLFRGKQEMHVIRHQAVRVHCASRFARILK